MKILFSKLSISIILFFCIYSVMQLYAGNQIELNLKDLCEQSDNIVIARVISTQSYLADSGNRILTKIDLQILETFKGSLRSFEKITITVLGGSVNGITTFVLDAPLFRVGEESILFLHSVSLPNNNKNYVISGLSQGKFNIFTDSILNIKKVKREQIETPLKTGRNYPTILITDKEGISLKNFTDNIMKYLK